MLATQGFNFATDETWQFESAGGAGAPKAEGCGCGGSCGGNCGGTCSGGCAAGCGSEVQAAVLRLPDHDGELMAARSGVPLEFGGDDGGPTGIKICLANVRGRAGDNGPRDCHLHDDPPAPTPDGPAKPVERGHAAYGVVMDANAVRNSAVRRLNSAWVTGPSSRPWDYLSSAPILSGYQGQSMANSVLFYKGLGCPGKDKLFLRGKVYRATRGHPWRWLAEWGAGNVACSEARAQGAKEAERIASQYSCAPDNCGSSGPCDGPVGSWEPFGDVGGLAWGADCVLSDNTWWCRGWCSINGLVTVTCSCRGARGCCMFPWNW